MSIPRNTDVSRHLASKLRLATNEPADPANTDLQSLTEDLSAAINSAQSTPASGRDQ